MTIFYKKSWYKWIVLVMCILAYSSGNLVRWNYTGISQYLVGEWHIGKEELGILGSAFFYAYAIGQSPWGTLTDIWGGRRVISVGILLTAVMFSLFAYAGGYHTAIIIRALMGFVGAATFVPCMAVLSRWFTKKERGMVLNIFSGTGGGIGELWSFLLMPLISLFMVGGATFFGLSSWRASTLIMTFVTLVIMLLCFIGMRSDPADLGLPSVVEQETRKQVKDRSYKAALLSALRDPWFWIITFAWQGFTVSLRLLPAWLPIYAAAYYKQTQGLSNVEAMVAGGMMASVYIAGRILGTPLFGKLSDVLLVRYNVPRTLIIACFHIFITLSMFILSHQMPSTLMFAVLVFVIGAAINMFPLVNAAVAEIWPVKTGGALMGMVNTVGQLIGASALAYSGFMANKFSVADAGYNFEYRGIWYLAMIFSSISIVASLLAIRREKQSIRENTLCQ
ncbi:MFS transporter [Intestinirhabdus alba]|jgi:sugar phosphate permease|uniref:MFS transporter n=1 Tax=Intestinirhabdus alba TaxID=2899544 RepID=A0A6L6IH76_9ENTR|nr:MFS transporter [Intestinirhabdus alba]MTH45257.1 MFS transporter [Intestinirhabdus alba]